MRIYDYETNRMLNDVALYLSAEEIEDLRAFLGRLAGSSDVQKVYLSEVAGHWIERELTVARSAA
jgi:hypothetical protein